MYKFRAKSNIVLGAMGLLSLLALFAVENGRVEVKQKWYDEKLEASKLTKAAADYLKNYRMERGVFIDDVNDPNQTALIGQEYTLVTTDRGNIDSKLTTTNPNFAAVIVQLFKDAGVHKGDHVAIAMTGSFPGLNISVLAACEVLHLKPIIITSVGASNFGANDPYFTWPDMESLFYEAGIFSNRSIAASIGGGSDIGRGLSPEGRHLIIGAIERNKLDFIHENHLESSISRRMELYEQHSEGKPIKAFVNIGGGIASLGNTINGRLIDPGLTEYLPNANYPVHGVMIQMGLNEVPIIHLLNIRELTAEFGLPNSPVPLPEPGDGGIFLQEKYSVGITAIATAILVIVIVLVYLGEQKYHRLGTDVVPATGDAAPSEKDADNFNEL